MKTSLKTREECDCGAPAEIVRNRERICRRCAALQNQRNQRATQRAVTDGHGLPTFRVLMPGRTA